MSSHAPEMKKAMLAIIATEATYSPARWPSNEDGGTDYLNHVARAPDRQSLETEANGAAPPLRARMYPLM